METEVSWIFDANRLHNITTEKKNFPEDFVLL